MEDEKLVQEINSAHNLSFLQLPEFSQAYQIRDWLSEFGNDSEGILELVGDIAESELLKV
jgi:hypothetical protein